MPDSKRTCLNKHRSRWILPGDRGFNLRRALVPRQEFSGIRRLVLPTIPIAAAERLVAETFEPESLVEYLRQPPPRIDGIQYLKYVPRDDFLAGLPDDQWAPNSPFLGRLAETACLASQFVSMVHPNNELQVALTSHRTLKFLSSPGRDGRTASRAVQRAFDG